MRKKCKSLVIYYSRHETTHSPSRAICIKKSLFLFLSLLIFIFPIFLACPIHQTYAATSHYIDVMTIRDNLFPGDTLRLYASAANNSGQDIYCDVFLGFIAPGGEIYFFDSSLNLLPSDETDPKTFASFAEDISLPTGFTLPSTEFFSAELPDYVPEGTWTAFAALTEAGSTKKGSVRLIGDISLAEMKFSKGGSGMDTTSITGVVTPPAGSSPDSLTVVSVGKPSPVSAQGDFSTEAYRDGVTLIAAMPEVKEFGLINIGVTTSQKTTTSSHAAKTYVKLKTAAYQDSNTGQITINAQTTAASMVFMTPYFLTNDPTRADEVLNLITNDPKVADLAKVIDDVFQENDPLSNPTLQQALIDAIQSVLDTLAASTSNASLPTVAQKSPAILYLPKAQSLPRISSTGTYYADQDYITVKANEAAGNYKVYIESKNGGSVDWFGELTQLNSAQFSSWTDLQAKAANNRSLYNRIATFNDQLEAPAKSFFRYLDVIELVINAAFKYVFGNQLADQIAVPSNQDAIYLLRSYSGAWGKLIDGEEKPFVRNQVIHGSDMDVQSLAVNVFNVAFDGISAFVDLKKIFGDELREVAKVTLVEALHQIPAVVNDPYPSGRDLLQLITRITSKIISELIKSITQQATKNLFVTIKRIGEISVSAAIDLPGKISKAGKAVDRVYQLLGPATPLETTIIVVGDPFSARNKRPYAPSNPSPADGATGVSITPTLSWSGGDPDPGDTVTYDVYFGTSSTPSKVSPDQSSTNYSPGTLAYSTTYYWKIIARDNYGKETPGSLWSFTSRSKTSLFSISGRVTSEGEGLDNVIVSLSGTASQSTTTDSNGNYSFTSVSNGSYTLTPSKTDCNFSPSSRSLTVSNGNVTNQDFTATCGAIPLSITTTSLSSGTVGVSYNSASLSATGGKTPYNWSITGRSLPPGLSLSTSGVISGTPTTAGTYNFTVQVKDSSSPQQGDSKALSIVVNPSSTPTVTSVNPNSGSQGQTLDVTIMGTNFTGATSISFGAGITVNNFAVNSSTQITANISISSTATTGSRDISVTTPAGTGTGSDLFTITSSSTNKSDLIIQNLAVNPSSGAAGSSGTVSFTIRNQGSGAANASTTNIRINTSASDVTTSDPLLASISTPSIAAEGSYNVNQSVTIPSNQTAGANYIWVIADVNSTANQSDESNDKANTVFTVQETTGSALQVSPGDGLSSSGTQGGPFSPSSKTYTLSNAGGSSINWTASKGKSWVSLSATSGTLAAGGNTTVTVSINSNANSLSPGNYVDTVSFTNSTNGSGDTTRSVNLTVNYSTPTITVGPTSLNFSNVQVGTCETAVFAIQHVLGTGPASGTVSVSPNPPFSISSGSSFSVSNGSGANVTVKFCPSSSGTFNGTATVSSSATFTGTNTVSLTGTGYSSGALSVSPSDRFDSSGSQGGPFSPSSKTYTLSNAGGSSINWTASKGKSWVSLSATSGTLAAGGNTTVTVSINSNANSLSPGNQVDTVSFTNSTNGSGDTTRSVNLTVNYSTPTITIGPASLNFGSVQVGSCSTAYFAIQHVSGTGSASGTVSASPNPPFSISSNGSFSVSNGQGVNVGVQFCPTSATTFSGSATVSSPGTTFTSTNTVTLSGTGVVNQPPVALFTMTSGSKSAQENQTLSLTVSPGGTATVSFSAARSYDPDGSITAYRWQISGTQVSTSRDFSYSLGRGTHSIFLTVTDDQGATGSMGGTVVVNEQSCPGKFCINDVVTVCNTGGAGLNLRQCASTNNSTCPVIVTMPDGTKMTVFSGPVQADGYTWWAISGYVNGVYRAGWAVENYLCK